MKLFAKLFKKHKVVDEVFNLKPLTERQRVLPPDVTPPLQTLLDQIEGYINAINTQKAAFDTSGIRLLCQNRTIDPAALLRLQTLSLAINSYKNDVDSCIALANA